MTTRRPLGFDDLYSIPYPSDPRLSPDGATVAYVVTRADRDTDSDHSAIWMVRDRDAPRRLTAGSHDSAPTFAYSDP